MHHEQILETKLWKVIMQIQLHEGDLWDWIIQGDIWDKIMEGDLADYVTWINEQLKMK